MKVEETLFIISSDLIGEILLSAGLKVLISGEKMGISTRGHSNGLTI